MTMPNGKADELARQLRTSLRRQRPRHWLLLAALLAASALLVGGLVWWFLPGAEPPVLAAFAADTILDAKAEPVAVAQLAAIEGDADTAGLQDRTVVFLDAAPNPAGPLREVEEQTDATGRARAAWAMPEGATRADFLVRYSDVKRRRASLDAGRIFRWPEDSRLAVVDVESTLADVPPERWSEADTNAIVPRAAAATALRTLAQDGRMIAYRARAGATLPHLRALRHWIDRHSTGATALPVGPVVSAVREPARFRGPHVLVSADREAVPVAGDVQRYWIGAAAPEGFTATEWAHLPALLAKQAPR